MTSSLSAAADMSYYSRRRCNQCGWREVFHLLVLLSVPLALSKLVKAEASPGDEEPAGNGVCSRWCQIAKDDIIDFTVSAYDNDMNPIER